MPNPPIKPPNKGADELRTEITLDLHKKFEAETDFRKRDTLMIDHLISQLVKYQVHFQEYEKIMNGFSKE